MLIKQSADSWPTEKFEWNRTPFKFFNRPTLNRCNVRGHISLHTDYVTDQTIGRQKICSVRRPTQPIVHFTPTSYIFCITFLYLILYSYDIVSTVEMPFVKQMYEFEKKRPAIYKRRVLFS